MTFKQAGFFLGKAALLIVVLRTLILLALQRKLASYLMFITNLCTFMMHLLLNALLIQ